MNSVRKYALVTGASSGIGWHLSEELAKLGYNIIAVSNQSEQLQELKNKLGKNYPVTVEIFDIDLALESSPQQLFEFCECKNYFVEVLINNAGTLIFSEAAKVDYNKTKYVLNLHVTTPALLCRLFMDKMVKSTKGYILNVSSISSVMPYPTISLYGPTKAFLRHYTRALRSELKRFGINVTCLLPGATITSLYDPGRFNTPMKRRLGIIREPDSVAKAGVVALFKNKPECIPGFLNKLIVYLLPVLPYFVIEFIYKRTKFIK